MLFLGSGISTIFDKPTTIQFKEHLTDIFDDPKKYGMIYHLLRYPQFLDIEYILETVSQILVYSRENLAHLFPDSSTVEGMKNISSSTFKNLIQEFEWINTEIENYVFEYYKWKLEYDNKLKHLYNEIFSFLKQYANQLIVATTNYDRAIEQFCLLTEYNYYDGFHNIKNRYIWKNSDFYYPEVVNSNTDIILLKLHGSLNWRETNDNQILREEQEGRPSDQNYKSVLIYPTLSVKNYETRELYKTLVNEFKNHLEKADICIIIGYSFRDSTFGSLLNSFIKSNKLPIVVGKNGIKNFYKQLLNMPVSDFDDQNIAGIIQTDNRKLISERGVGFIRRNISADNITDMVDYIKGVILL